MIYLFQQVTAIYPTWEEVMLVNTEYDKLFVYFSSPCYQNGQYFATFEKICKCLRLDSLNSFNSAEGQLGNLRNSERYFPDNVLQFRSFKVLLEDLERISWKQRRKR